MAKYKVGDVAALFSKPKEPTTQAGKKLQSLFEDFHHKKNESKKTANLKQKDNWAENENSEDHKNSKRNKKRKFSALTESDSILDFENNTNKVDDEQGGKNSDKKFKGSNNNLETDFPRKKKKKISSFESNASVETGKKGIVKNEFEPVDINEKTHTLNLGSIKKSKHKKNKKNVSVSLDEANSKSASVKNDFEAIEDDDNDDSFKEEIKQLIENHSKKTKLGKNKKFDTNQVSLKKSFDFIKTPEVKSKSDDTLKDSGENKQNQTPDFVRKPKIKNKEKNNSAERYYSKDTNNAFNGNEALFATDHEENGISKANFERKFNGTDNSSLVSPQKRSEKSELDFIKISDSKPDDKERLDRTIFVGNLPININKKALSTLFSPFGEIESIRCLKIETNKSKIFSKNPPKSLNSNYGSDTVPGFVVFKEKQSAIDALSLCGTVFKDRHITVDIALPQGTKKLYDAKRSIFIGNLPFGVKDETIWNAFSECGRIEGVRIVRDRETGIGKGFGYVVFSTIQSKENALALKDLKIEGRFIRIKAVESDNEKQKSKETSVNRDTFKSRAIRSKKNNKNPNSRKSVTKLVKKEKTKHNKKKIAAILQKSMK